MYIKMQDNKSLLITVPSTIYRGETGADTLVFLVPFQYEDIKTADCSVMLRYIDADQIGHAEQLKMLPEMYNNYLQYTIPIDTNLTATAGKVVIWLSCISCEDAVVFKTGELTIEVKPSVNIEQILPPEGLDQLDKLTMEVSDLQKTKADNLIFDEDDGSLQLSAAGVPIGDEVTVPDNSYSIIDGGGAV